MRKKQPSIPWRTERQLRGLQSLVSHAIRCCTDGSTIELDIATGEALIEALQQLRKYEYNHQEAGK